MDLSSQDTCERWLPDEGRLASIDFGTVRLGVATCDPSQNWVAPVATYCRRNERLDALHFLQFVKEQRLVGWVVGLPIHCDGRESQKSAEARSFAVWLEQVTELPVVMFDERFTTAEARRLLNETHISGQKKKRRLDGLAAHLILTHFLESRRRTTSQNEAIEDSPPPPD